MSAETMEWLNRYTLIGFTAKRGNAWHYRQDLQEGNGNHYKGAIPVADVLDRLFNFEVEEMPLFIVADGKRIAIPGRKAMVTSDSRDVLGIFKDGYQGHSYKEWLLDTVGTILDDSLQIGSAGLLRNRAQAFVSVEVPDNFTTPEGVEFRPNLLACTSYDGTLATTYKRVVTAVVCDNTLSAGLSEAGQVFKVKHSRYSNVRIQDARDALAIVNSMAEDFAAEVAALTSWKVTDKHFEKHLNALIPLPDEDGNAKTRAESKRDSIVKLYREDERCAPWNGTAFGVMQAHNTYMHHFQSVRKGVPRFMRNMENVVRDKFAAADSNVLTVLSDVTGHKLAA